LSWKNIIAQELFNTITVIYFQYWFALEVKFIYLGQMAILHAHFGYKTPIGGSGMFVGPIINHVILDQHSTFFKLTMLNHFQDAMLPQNDVNPTMRLWEGIVPNGILNHKLSKWF